MINPSSPIKYLKALLIADFSVLLKTRRSLVISLVFPIFLLFVWNTKATLNAYGGALFVIAITMSVGLLSLSVFGYSLAVGRDREKGVFQRLRVTPAPAWTIMVSRLLVYEIANLIIAIVVLVVGCRLYHVSLNPSDYALVLLVAVLGGAVFLSIGQALVGLIKSADTLNSTARFVYIAFVIFALLGLSGALGHTLETVAKWSPLGTVITVFAGIPHLGLWTTHTSLALLTCFGYIVVFSYVGIKWFQWEAR